jgi:signal peptidase I
VALGKDSIKIEEKKIIVNGQNIRDGVKRIWNNWDYGAYATNKTLEVPDNYVYVLSDNLAAHHDDSRVFGPIKESSIVGVLW